MTLPSVIEKLHSSKGRLLAGLGMLSALAVGLSPDESRQFDIGKTAAFILALAVWLFAELGGVSNPSALDVELYRRIKGTIDEQALTFLLQHDFGASLGDKETRPVGEVCSWHGASIEFRDSKIQKSWDVCRNRFETLNRLYAQYLGPTTKVDRLSVIPPGTDEWNVPEYLMQAVEALNSAASDSYRLFNEFDRVAKDRLNL